jgi:peptide deformylase
MKIIVPKAKARTVESFEDIKETALAMQTYLENNLDVKNGKISKFQIALHHAQTDPIAYNFFVVKRDLVGAKRNEVVVVINPEILEIDRETGKTVLEGCMSFPFRPDKKVKRYSRVKVKYQLPGKDGKLETKEEWVNGVIAHIFQHEVEHSKGNHIYK